MPRLIHGLFAASCLLSSCAQSPPHTPTASTTPAVSADSAAGNGLLGEAQWRAKWQAAANLQGLRPAFGVFYQDSAGQFYFGHDEMSDAAPESEEAAFIVFAKCPPLDSATFHYLPNSSYSADRNGVYYTCFSGHEILFLLVTGADPTTFRAVADLDFGYDARHVFLRNSLLPKLRSEALRIYTGPDHTPDICGADDAYFTDGNVVVKNQELTPLAGAAFRPPKGYTKAYSR